MNLLTHIVEWLESVGADGLISDRGIFYPKDEIADIVSVIYSVPAWRWADGTYHTEPEEPQACRKCFLRLQATCSKKSICIDYQSWLAHKED